MSGLLASFFYLRRSARPRCERRLVLNRVSSFVEVFAIVSVTIAGGGLMSVLAAENPPLHAGADNRTKNQLSPGLLATPQDTDFSELLGEGPNYQLTAADFPFRKLSNPNCRVDAAVNPQCPDGPSELLSDTNDVVSSQGVFSSVNVPFLVRKGKYLSLGAASCIVSS
jgi:hypothetical protein